MVSWDATGRLAALWGRVGGRDNLADLTGIAPTTLSGYNQGRRKLGLRNGERIADALQVTIFDLGAPTTAQAAEQAATLLDRVEVLEGGLAAALREIDELRRPPGDEA